MPHSRRSCRTALVALGVCTLGGWRGPCPACPYKVPMARIFYKWRPPDVVNLQKTKYEAWSETLPQLTHRIGAPRYCMSTGNPPKNTRSAARLVLERVAAGARSIDLTPGDPHIRLAPNEQRWD